jgi:acyl-CoA dehydrogenase
MRRAPLWQWAAAAGVLGILSRLGFDETGFGIHIDVIGWIFALLPGVILALFTIPQVRQMAVTGPIYGLVKKVLPRVSRTEQEALDAGITWEDG